MLYTVDEWLRFRSGESRLSLVVKAVLGLAWFFVTYVVRFCVNLLIEPQINPIKHFPVVTVSHKLLLPLIPAACATSWQSDHREGAGRARWPTVDRHGHSRHFRLPGLGVEGELAPVCREPAPNLGPCRIGHHGETLARLLRPGFHSGTIPKRFARLRRADRASTAPGQSKAARKHLRELHHIELAVRRYVQRELVEFLTESKDWNRRPPTAGEIRLGTNRITMAIVLSQCPEQKLLLVFEMRSGWMFADARVEGPAAALSPRERSALEMAIQGLYKTAGVDLTRRQIEGAFSPYSPRYDIVAEGLRVWPDDTEDAEVLYDLRGEGRIEPQVVRGSPGRSLPALERRQILFRDVPITWERWVEAWERHDRDGRIHAAVVSWS